MKPPKDRYISNYLKVKWERCSLGILWKDHSTLIPWLAAVGLLIVTWVVLNSCEANHGELPCMKVQPVDWNMKCDPIIKVPIPGALDYYEVKALLYNDSNESTLMKHVVVKKDTVILNAVDIDLTEYQNEKQYCEIYLINYN